MLVYTVISINDHIRTYSLCRSSFPRLLTSRNRNNYPYKHGKSGYPLAVRELLSFICNKMPASFPVPELLIVLYTGRLMKWRMATIRLQIINTIYLFFQRFGLMELLIANYQYE